MSHSQDRARAELGTIFRDGQLVNKDDWYKSHPTKEMILAQTQKPKRARRSRAKKVATKGE